MLLAAHSNAARLSSGDAAKRRCIEGAGFFVAVTSRELSDDSLRQLLMAGHGVANPSAPKTYPPRHELGHALRKSHRLGESPLSATQLHQVELAPNEIGVEIVDLLDRLGRVFFRPRLCKTSVRTNNKCRAGDPW